MKLLHRVKAKEVVRANNLTAAHASFFTLPAELRNQIYFLVIANEPSWNFVIAKNYQYSQPSSVTTSESSPLPRKLCPLARTCRQIRIELLPMLHLGKVPRVRRLGSRDQYDDVTRLAVNVSATYKPSGHIITPSTPRMCRLVAKIGIVPERQELVVLFHRWWRDAENQAIIAEALLACIMNFIEETGTPTVESHTDLNILARRMRRRDPWLSRQGLFEIKGVKVLRRARKAKGTSKSSDNVKQTDVGLSTLIKRFRGCSVFGGH